MNDNEEVEVTPAAKRARLSHAQYHKAAMHIASQATADTSLIDATPVELSAQVLKEAGIDISPAQVRSMCKELALTIKVDKPGAAGAQLAHQVATLAGQLENISKQLGNIFSVLEDTSAVMDSQNAALDSQQKDIDAIKKVMNDHAKRLTSWQPVDPPL
jgi:hypothetical protein